MRNTKPTITPAPNGPYLGKDLETLRNSKDETLETQPTVALCRCSASKNQPFCDGTHWSVEFTDQEN
jgi:CDGSH-type Zn-finger protein